MGSGTWRLAAGGHALSLVERRRAQAVLRRIRSLSTFFAVATVAWIPVDALVFAAHTAYSLAFVRCACALALFALAVTCETQQPTMREARRRSVLLFAVPALFYVASLEIFSGGAFGPSARIVVNAYSFVPFVLAAGLAALPLSMAECAALLLVALASEAFALQWHAGETPFITAEALWLQLLVGAVASYAALSQRAMLGELVAQAVKDPLTGCHRRESGRELLGIQFHLARRRAAPIAALFVDLDRFKRVNDELGHDAGDEVLAAAAASIRAGLRLSDVLVRWGGEEFLVVLPDTGLAEASAISERVRTLAARRLPNGLPITLSIGIAERLHDRIDDPDVLIEVADRRMYRAKQAGRDRCVSSDDAC
jgi:diguanylate cyclase (GGDEF)-like protein